MTANEIINNSSPTDAPVWELPPLYKRINWAALLVPPIGIIILLLAAIYIYPFLRRRFGGSDSKASYTAKRSALENGDRREVNEDSLELSEDFNDVRWDTDSLNYSGTLDRLQSTPKHKLVNRITPTPSPKLGRLSLSPMPPLASQENILF